MTEEPQLCECGCGDYAKPGNRFIWGHHLKYKSPETLKKISEALMGRKLSDETCKKMSDARLGKNNPMFGKNHTEETCNKIAEKLIGRKLPSETCKKMSEAREGHSVSDKTRQRLSAAHQGIPYDEWENYASKKEYCPLFDEECRESNREKYDRRCFICGKLEEENITKNGDQWQLSVHHIDMDKGQGCNGVRWKLVPTCLHCHLNLHNEIWAARIMWLLENIY